MNCPFCESNQIMVMNSRPTKRNSQIWRRRKCITCEESFTSYEKIDLSYITVIKKSGKRKKYKRAKLYSSIYHSSIDKKNVDRGKMSEISEKFTTKIEQKLLSLKRKEISSVEIRNAILKELAKKSPDTFLRFLAYREGHNKKEMKKLLKKHY